MSDLDGRARCVAGVDRTSDARIRRAQLAVAERSEDVVECRELLDMLGLLPDQPALRLSDASRTRVPKHLGKQGDQP